MNSAFSTKLRRLLAYPGWLDLFLILGTHWTLKHWVSEPEVAIAVVISVGVVRFLMAYSVSGVLLPNSRNYFIKQAIFVMAGSAVAMLYSTSDVAWTFAVYFTTTCLLETTASIAQKRSI